MEGGGWGGEGGGGVRRQRNKARSGGGRWQEEEEGWEEGWGGRRGGRGGSSRAGGSRRAQPGPGAPRAGRYPQPPGDSRRVRADHRPGSRGARACCCCHPPPPPPGGGEGGGLPRLTTPCPRQGKQPEARHPHTDTPASSQGLEQVPLSRSNFPNRQRAPPSPLSTHPGPRCEPGPKRTPARGLGDRQRKARALGRPEASSSFPEGAREQCRCLGRSANVILGGVEEAEIKSLLLRVSAQTGKLGVPLLRAGERSWRRLGSREGLPIWSWILFSSLVWGTVAISTYTGCLFQSS